MRRLILSLMVGLSLLVPAASASADGPCQFQLGFATVAGLIPQAVGQCTENEGHNPLNGDGLQHSTGGLLVWRKADNWTAFTDGYHSWINGPNGLQQRLNTERFPWEANTESLQVTPGAEFDPAWAASLAAAHADVGGLHLSLSIEKVESSVSDVSLRATVKDNSDIFLGWVKLGKTVKEQWALSLLQDVKARFPGSSVAVNVVGAVFYTTVFYGNDDCSYQDYDYSTSHEGFYTRHMYARVYRFVNKAYTNGANDAVTVC